jgi:type VI secretion system secreted protein VgrG
MALASAVQIEIDGKEIMDFLNISIDQGMNDLQEFHVTCRMDTFEDPDGFVMNKSKKFIGSIISIAIDSYKPGGEESVPGVFFKGIIHSIKAVKSDLSQEDQVVLSGYSPDILLNDHAGCRSFENKTLKQIVDEVLKPYPRDVLKASVNPGYKEQIPYCVKYNENRLDFLHRLTARYGEWMYYTGSELNFSAPNGKTEELILGEDLNTFDFSF